VERAQKEEKATEGKWEELEWPQAEYQYLKAVREQSAELWEGPPKALAVTAAVGQKADQD
jgi:hypothetical protein